MQYCKLPANDEWVNHEWAEQNKDENGEITDTAVVANDPRVNPKTNKAIEILSKSYVHKGGAKITQADMTRWGGFPAHKDPTAKMNAVAYPEEVDRMSLEGPIRQQVMMGDVEGYVYGSKKDLVKNLKKNKFTYDPSDKYSQPFVEAIKAGDEEGAINTLVERTKSGG